MRSRCREDGHALRVARRHAVHLSGLERSVLEGPHRVHPRLARAVHKAAVYPARDAINLHKAILRALLVSTGASLYLPMCVFI